MRRHWPNRWRWPSGRCAVAACGQVSESRWWGLARSGSWRCRRRPRSGPGSVAVVEPLPERRALAVRLGADRAVPPEDAPALEADVAVECAGASNAIQTALQALRSGGRAVLLSIVTESAPVAPMDLVPRREIPDRLAVTRLGRGLPGGAATAGPWGGAGGAVDHHPHPARCGGDGRPHPAAGRTGTAPQDPRGGGRMSAGDGSGVLPDMVMSRLYAAVVSRHPRRPRAPRPRP